MLSSSAVAAEDTDRLSSAASVARQPVDRRPDDVVADPVQVPSSCTALSRWAAIGLSMACCRCAGSVQCTLRAIRMRPSTSSCFFGRCCGTSATTRS